MLNNKFGVFLEEGKDLNTLSVEDLIRSLKCHEIGLNEHESIKKHKSITLKSRGKSSKALKALESEEESTSGISGNALQQTAISGQEEQEVLKQKHQSQEL